MCFTAFIFHFPTISVFHPRRRAADHIASAISSLEAECLGEMDMFLAL